VTDDIVARLRVRALNLLNSTENTTITDAATEWMLAADEIERLRAEVVRKADELARLRERVTMLVEAAVEDAERAARLERVITNKEPLL
jgi:predicted transcriptional regulator